MTMAEFNIRLFSFKRQNESKELLIREVAYYSMVGSHLDPKKLPKSKQSFWRIGNENKPDTEKLSNLAKIIRLEKEKYNKRNK